MAIAVFVVALVACSFLVLGILEGLLSAGTAFICGILVTTLSVCGIYIEFLEDKVRSLEEELNFEEETPETKMEQVSREV